MDVASYPVPVPIPLLPSITELGLSAQVRKDLSSNTGGRANQERVLQGEVIDRLNDNNQSRPQSTTDRLLFEQRANKRRADLSGLGTQQKIAIASYLDTEELSARGYQIRTLIDEFV